MKISGLTVCDGCWWKVVQGSRKDLQGERKFATCLGSYICNNLECPKYTTEKVKNLMDFKHGPKGVTLARYVDIMSQGYTMAL